MRFLLPFLLLFTPFLYGKDVVRVLNRTESGRLIHLNIGKGDLEKDDWGLLVLLSRQKTSHLKHSFRYIPLAKAQLVKAGKRNSLWFLDRPLSRKTLRVSSRYLLYRKSDLLRGRASHKIKKTKVVGNSREIIGQENAPSRVKLRSLHPIKWQGDRDVEEIDLYHWATHREGNLWFNKETMALIPKKALRTAPGVEVSEVRDLETYERMLVEYLKKVNDPKMSWLDRKKAEEDYLEQKGSISREGREKLATNKEREKILLEKKLHGEGWSKDYSASDMRQWIDKHGSIVEKEIRDEMVRYSLLGGFHLSAGMNLLSNELKKDYQNTRKFRFHGELAYEWMLFRTLRNYLNNFSMELSYRQALDGLAMGVLNALTVESSFAFKLHWYPTSPHGMEKNVFFLGVSARLGKADLSVKRTAETGSYSVFGFGLLGGYRYNFNSGWGARMILGFEQLAFRSASRSRPIIHLKDNVGLGELRVQVGVSYVF